MKEKTNFKAVLAFTLIELLAVIAVIGVLAAIIIPVVGKVRNRAEIAENSSNLRQIHTGFGLFANDNSGRIPVTDGRILAGPQQWRWYGIEPAAEDDGGVYKSPLMEYLDIDSVRKFNEITIPVSNQTSEPQSSTRGAYGFPYIVNYYLMPNGSPFDPVYFSSVSEASSKVLMTDSEKNDWGPGFSDKAGFERIGVGDDGKTMILWADGHVSRMKKERLVDDAEKYMRSE